MTPFIADTLEAEVDDTAEIPAVYVWLSESSSTPCYLQFEKQIEPDEQDVSLGFDFPYIEICDQGYSGYDLVEKVVCDSKTLTVHFNAKGRRALQTDDDYQIGLSSNLDLKRMAEMMREIFGDKFVLIDGE